LIGVENKMVKKVSAKAEFERRNVTSKFSIFCQQKIS